MASKIIILIINAVAIAIPVSLVEISIEKNKGWGQGLSKKKWYGKIIGKNNQAMRLLARIVGVPHFFGYAIFVYFFLIPLILLIEYFFLITNFLLVIAIYFAVLAIEDFSWFILNWHFPALRELLKGPYGNIWWHKRWIKISKKRYLPFSYFLSIAIATLLLILS